MFISGVLLKRLCSYLEICSPIFYTAVACGVQALLVVMLYSREMRLHFNVGKHRNTLVANMYMLYS